MAIRLKQEDAFGWSDAEIGWKGNLETFRRLDSVVSQRGRLSVASISIEISYRGELVHQSDTALDREWTR